MTYQANDGTLWITRRDATRCMLDCFFITNARKAEVQLQDKAAVGEQKRGKRWMLLAGFRLHCSLAIMPNPWRWLQGSVAAKDRREPRDSRRSGVASGSRIREDGMFCGTGLKELLSMGER